MPNITGKQNQNMSVVLIRPFISMLTFPFRYPIIISSVTFSEACLFTYVLVPAIAYCQLVKSKPCQIDQAD